MGPLSLRGAFVALVLLSLALPARADTCVASTDPNNTDCTDDAGTRTVQRMTGDGFSVEMSNPRTGMSYSSYSKTIGTAVVSQGKTNGKDWSSQVDTATGNYIYNGIDQTGHVYTLKCTQQGGCVRS